MSTQDINSILATLRAEFPDWKFGLRAGGHPAKCWKYGDEPPASQVDDYALVSYADGAFRGSPLGDTEAVDFPTLIEAAEYALGQKALSACRIIDAEVPREYDNGDPETDTDKSSPRKDFTTKPRITLIPAHVLSAHILPVLHDGAKKHGRDHWRKCTPREYVEAAVTHALAFLDGDDIDESGHHALAHAAADIILALGKLTEEANGTH